MILTGGCLRNRGQKKKKAGVITKVQPNRALRNDSGIW